MATGDRPGSPPPPPAPFPLAWRWPQAQPGCVCQGFSSGHHGGTGMGGCRESGPNPPPPAGVCRHGRGLGPGKPQHCASGCREMGASCLGWILSALIGRVQGVENCKLGWVLSRSWAWVWVQSYIKLWVEMRGDETAFSGVSKVSSGASLCR